MARPLLPFPADTELELVDPQRRPVSGFVMLPFTAGVFEQDAVLLYCAVRFYIEHPELREELSTIVAQRRFERWDRALSLR
ncbi:hypothetical protein [Agromyces laixinhei]|uniref:hypothetical protein n=1 Tax=Agromyces laixinhei TaxID=2585717 RepID=UPI0012ECBFC8|nr:hypothetical protein [Agromyces laixinhei]